MVNICFWVAAVILIIVLIIIVLYVLRCLYENYKDSNGIRFGELSTVQVCDTITGMAENEAKRYIYDCQKRVLEIKQKNLYATVWWRCTVLFKEYSQIVIVPEPSKNDRSMKSVVLALDLAYKNGESKDVINRAYASELVSKYKGGKRSWENTISAKSKDMFGLDNNTAKLRICQGAIDLLCKLGEDEYPKTIVKLRELESKFSEQM